MTNLPNHLPLPLAGFVRRLRAAGFSVDAGREFQLRRVLHEQGADYIGRFGELKYALAPYVVTNAGEQRRFYRLWDDYVESLEAQLVEPVKEVSPSGWRKWAKPLRYLLIGLVLLSLVFLAWNLARNSGPVQASSFVKVDLQQEAEARAGQPLQIRNATLLEEARDSVDFVWDIRDEETGQSLHRQDSFDLHYVIPDTMTGRSLRVVLWAQELVSETKLGVANLTLAVLCADPPLIPPFTDLPAKVLQGETWPVPAFRGRNLRTNGGGADPEVVVRLLINGEMLEETPEEYVFSQEGQTKVQLLAQRADDPENCFTLSPPRNVQVGSNIPVIPIIPLKKDDPRQILKAAGWLYLLPLLLGLGLYWLHRRHWRNKEEHTRDKTDEELAEEYPFHDVGPYVIPYQDQSGQISVPADFYRIADQLRVREASLRMAFDGRATVEATVREGGFPSWRERAVKRPANYLVLLRHTDEFQQQDRLLKRLTDFLIVREAELDVYYHGGDFTWFWNETHPQGWSPTQMAARYGEHRLIILGDGHGLVDAFHRREPRLEPTRERWLLKWNRRLLLTTEPAVDWSFQEVLLHKALILYPATTNGILRGVADLNQVEDYQGSSYSRWKAERFRRNPEPSHRYRTWTTVADHRDYLAHDPELFRWLTALSVAPNPDWSLTIAIGRSLGINVTHDRLLQLSRIPWLASNAPDQDLRLAFLAELSVVDEQLARAATLEQLEAVSGEVENTFAESEWTANRAVQRFALAPLETGNQTKIRELRRMGMLTPDQLAELNQVAERQFPANKGGKQQPGDESALDELLNPPPKPGEILNEREKELLGLIVVCLLLFLPMYLYNKAGNELNPGEPKSVWQELENPTDDAHLALEQNNLAVSGANLLEKVNGYMRSPENKVELEGKIQAALDQALVLMDGRYPLVDTNQAAFQLNRLAFTLNWVAADSALLGPMLNEDINELLAEADAAITDKFPGDSRFALQKLHAEGMFAWLTFRAVQITAEDKSGAVNPWIDAFRIKNRIDSLNPRFLTELTEVMPVNLAYLLANEPRPLFNFDGRIITGSVVDTTGTPVSGALVRLGGTNKGTVTDEEGKFALALTQGKPYLEVSWQEATPIEVGLLLPDGGFRPANSFGDIVLNVPDVPEITYQEPEVIGNELRGRVVDESGAPLAGVSLVFHNTANETRTNANGEFVQSREGGPITNKLGVHYTGYLSQNIDITYEGDLFSPDDLGEIVMKKDPAEEPETEEEQTIEGLLSRFQSEKYTRFVNAAGTLEQANAHINHLTSTLKANSGRRGFLTGDELLSSLQEEFGRTISVKGSPQNPTARGQFLFFGPSIRLPRLANPINQIRKNSEALIFTTSRFEDPAFSGYPDLAGSTANLTNELRKFGFNVRTILDPTRAEMKAAITQAARKAYDPSSQFLLMFNTYVIEEDIITSDSRYGDPATYLGSGDTDGLQEWILDHPHMIFMANTVNLPVVPPDTNQQRPVQSMPQNTIILTRSEVTEGPLGIGINYRPSLIPKVTASGTMVFSVCIDSYGRVTSTEFNQEKSSEFAYAEVQAVRQNARNWRFDVSPKGQPEQQCGEVSFVFK